ncbi:MAG TPA: UDP-N-acetylmuramoyl-L-alanine--D-glutamate ligase [bacterium]
MTPVAVSQTRPSADASAARPASVDVFGCSWKGRRVTVVGLGKSGRAAAELLCRLGCEVRVTDAQDSPVLRAAREALLEYGAADVELGGHTTRAVEAADLIVTSPGIHEDTPALAWARARQLPVISEIELAFHFCRAPVVAVTGTNGKSSAVTLLTAILRAARRAAVACGNLGTPFSSVVEALPPEGVAVVEVSSFQLLGCERFRPSVGMLLIIGANHLDRHHDHLAYVQAKMRLFARQTREDWAVLNAGDPEIAARGAGLTARSVWFGRGAVNAPAFALAPQTQGAIGPSVQAVLQAARIFGIPDAFTWQQVRAFRGLEHRMEPAGRVRGVTFVNDAKSTTPESLMYALRRTRGPVVPIIGGRNKGLDLSPMVPLLSDPRVRGVVLIGEARAELCALLGSAGGGAPPVREAGTLEEAVETARGLAGPGATVLFSPACASFDMFRNFEARGAAFKAVVARLGVAALAASLAAGAGGDRT